MTKIRVGDYAYHREIGGIFKVLGMQNDKYSAGKSLYHIDTEPDVGGSYWASESSLERIDSLTEFDRKYYDTDTKIYTCDNCGTKLGEIACSNSKGGSYCSVKCADADEVVTVDATQCSPQVLDMLANLASRLTALEQSTERRITSLESQLRDTQGNVERQAEELAELHHATAEHIGIINKDITLLDERTYELVEPKQAAEALLRKIAKLIEEEGVGR